MIPKSKSAEFDIVVTYSFCLSDKSEFNENYRYEISGEGNYSFDNGLKVSVKVTSDRSGWDDESVGFFSIKKVQFPIAVRNYKPGDRFRPLGIKGYKKIKDLFIDEKVPRFLRKTVPIFETADGVIWVGGIRNDDRFKVGKGEKKFLRIKIKKAELKLFNKF